MHAFSIKQGDTKPSLEAVLRDEHGNPRRLVDASEIEFHMRHVETQELIIDDTATIIDPEEGNIVYEWKDGDTDVTGNHVAEFEVFYDGGYSETFPNSGDIEIYVAEAVA